MAENKKRSKRPWALIIIVVLLFVAFITNISETEFKSQTQQKIENLVDKGVERQDNIWLKILSPLAKPYLTEFIEIDIRDYYLFSLAYVYVPNLTDNAEDRKEKTKLFGISAFGRTFYPNDDAILDRVLDNDSDDNNKE